MLRIRKNIPDFYRAYGRAYRRIQLSFIENIEDIHVKCFLLTQMKILRTIQMIIDSFWCIVYPKIIKKNHEEYLKEKAIRIGKTLLRILGVE